MMKHTYIFLLCLMPMMGIAQTAIAPLEVATDKLKAWDTEINLDTIDQEKLPQRVTGGVMGVANISNFIIYQSASPKLFSSYMKIGTDIGGFVDFTVTKHFAIQGRLLVTAEQSRFKDPNEQDLLWAFGFEIPVLFLARFGNLEKGYLSFGGGPYTHFNFASNIGKKGAEDYSLHDNNFGLGTTIFYEFPIGIQIMANYLVSLTDIISFQKQNSAEASSVQGMYPQRVEVGIAYRWRTQPTKGLNR